MRPKRVSAKSTCAQSAQISAGSLTQSLSTLRLRKMKPFTKIIMIRPTFFLCVGVATLFSSVAVAQFENDIRSSANEIIRDNAVAPVDFQSDLNSKFNSVDDGIRDALQNQSGLGAMPHESPSNEFGLDFLNSQSASSWFGGLKKQAHDVQLPKVIGSLAIVLGGYLGFVWLTRKMGGNANHGLPQEVVEVLGHTPFGAKKTLQLVRLGSKLLLLMNSPEGTQSIGEITDPHEVEYLISLCGGKKMSRSAVAIRKASSSPVPTNAGADLKRVLQQLQRTVDVNGNHSVFEA